jgi:hypothetical protein
MPLSYVEQLLVLSAQELVRAKSTRLGICADRLVWQPGWAGRPGREEARSDAASSSQSVCARLEIPIPV